MAGTHDTQPFALSTETDTDSATAGEFSPLGASLSSFTLPDGEGAEAYAPIVLSAEEALATGEPVVVPGGAWFLRGDFTRDGSDLIITGPDGQEVLIEDYFDADYPPAIASSEGVTLDGLVVARLAGPMVPGEFASAEDEMEFLAQVSEPVGTVETLEGTVEVTRADGTVENLSVGDPIYQGDIMDTAADSSVGVLFVDESKFSLGEDGYVTIDELVYSAEAQSGSAALTMLQGTFSFVSGAIAKTDPDAAVIDTPVGTIGIRGTGGGGSVSADGDLTVAILPETGGITGEIIVANANGTTIINTPNTGVNVAPGAAPTVPIPFSAEQIGQVFGSALSGLPGVADSFPEAVVEGAEAGVEAAREAEAAAAEATAAVEEAAGEAAAAEAEAAEAAAEAEAAAAEAEAAVAEAEALAAAATTEAEQAEAAAALAAAAEAEALAAEAQAAVAAAEAEAAEALAAVAAAEAEAAEAEAAVLQTSPAGATASAAADVGVTTSASDALEAAAQDVQAAQAQAQAAAAEAEATQAQAEAAAIAAQAAEAASQEAAAEAAVTLEGEEVAAEAEAAVAAEPEAIVAEAVTEETAPPELAPPPPPIAVFTPTLPQPVVAATPAPEPVLDTGVTEATAPEEDEDIAPETTDAAPEEDEDDAPAAVAPETTDAAPETTETTDAAPETTETTDAAPETTEAEAVAPEAEESNYYIFGDSGNNNIEPALYLRLVDWPDRLLIEGKAGSDIIDLAGMPTDTEVNFLYNDPSDGGDEIVGSSTFSFNGGSDVKFVFDANNFNGAAENGDLRAETFVSNYHHDAPDASTFWYFNDSSGELQYDADGFGTGNAAITIATVSHPTEVVDIEAEDIIFVEDIAAYADANADELDGITIA